MNSYRGLATGIGSLPHKDAGQALDLIFNYVPNIPFWPQLPKRDLREGMVSQFSENIPCIRIGPEGLSLNLENKEKELENFYERIIANDVEYFRISQDYALGLYKFIARLRKASPEGIHFIKCQVTGPFTFAASLTNEKGIALVHDAVFMQVILKALAMKALWQINLFRKFGKKIILFFDEPYLGCFGSAFTPINREDVVNALSELFISVKSEDILLGVHCCGNTDWSIFTNIDSLDIISFDAFGFLDRLALYADNLQGFLNKGGILCWGIVPTQETGVLGKAWLDSLLNRLNIGMDTLVKKGIDKELILNNLLLSPSCGMGTLVQNKAEEILSTLSEISEKIKI